MARDTETSKSDQDRHFVTLQREITVAAREQGGDPDQNFRLSDAMRRARDANMPDQMIERARKQGLGEVAGPDYQVATFEGYGPDGVAVLIEAITDDPRQTAAELEELLEAHGGNLGEDGCVSWQFERRGMLRVDERNVDDGESFMLEAIEMGASDLREPVFDTFDSGRLPTYRVYCDPTNVRQIDRALEDAGYPVYSAKVSYEATQRVELEADRARNFLNFFEKLTSREDVQDAYANWRVA